LHRRCDDLLDEPSPLPAFAQKMLEAAVGIEQLAAASLIELHASDDNHRFLAKCQLEQLSVDGFYSLDPDHHSLLLDSLQQQRTLVVTDRAVPEAGLKRHSVVIS